VFARCWEDFENKKSGNAFIYRLNQSTQAMTKAEKRQFLKWFASWAASSGVNKARYFPEWKGNRESRAIN
jgi:hypothetical protein